MLENFIERDGFASVQFREAGVCFSSRRSRTGRWQPECDRRSEAGQVRPLAARLSPQ
jgi:hypothetical protein